MHTDRGYAKCVQNETVPYVAITKPGVIAISDERSHRTFVMKSKRHKNQKLFNG